MNEKWKQWLWANVSWIQMEVYSLETIDSCRYLGVNLDSEITYQKQLKNLRIVRLHRQWDLYFWYFIKHFWKPKKFSLNHLFCQTEIRVPLFSQNLPLQSVHRSSKKINWGRSKWFSKNQIWLGHWKFHNCIFCIKVRIIHMETLDIQGRRRHHQWACNLSFLVFRIGGILLTSLSVMLFQCRKKNSKKYLGKVRQEMLRRHKPVLILFLVGFCVLCFSLLFFFVFVLYMTNCLIYNLTVCDINQFVIITYVLG